MSHDLVQDGIGSEATLWEGDIQGWAPDRPAGERVTRRVSDAVVEGHSDAGEVAGIVGRRRVTAHLISLGLGSGDPEGFVRGRG
jgi:hypothetical protein